MTNIFLLNLFEYCLIPHGKLCKLRKNLTIISLINCPEKNTFAEKLGEKKSRLTESQQNGYVRFLASVDSLRSPLLSCPTFS